MTFSDLNLNAPLLNALDDFGYTKPTTIQARAFSVIMSGRDVCGIAQTGTGKTFLPLLVCRTGKCVSAYHQLLLPFRCWSKTQ